MAKTDLLYLGHMLDAARETQQLITGMSRAQFDQDRTARLALVQLVQTIGEAAKRVSQAQQTLIPISLAANSWDAQPHRSRLHEYKQ